MDGQVAGASAQFWTIVQAVGTVLSGTGAIIVLLFIWKQISRESRVAGCDFILKVSAEFDAREMRDHRTRLAGLVLSSSYLRNETLDSKLLEQMRPLASPVLGWFEDLGMMVRKGLVPTYFVWSTNEARITFYYEAMRSYVTAVQQTDPDFYTDFRYLYRTIRRFELKRHPTKLIREGASRLRHRLSASGGKTPSSPDDPALLSSRRRMREGFLRELNLHIRTLESEDVVHTLVPVKLRDRLLEYHRTEHYVAIAEILRSGDAGHEYLGYIVGTTVENPTREYEGKIVEMFVDSHFRGNGIGRRLCEHFCRLLRQWDIHSCRVMLRSDARSFNPYETIGFVKGPYYRDYFGRGRHAFEFRWEMPHLVRREDHPSPTLLVNSSRAS
jgi:ribosomal protein S18 acetylase RimI-like enzyme